MALKLSVLARTAAGQAIANLIDEGTENDSAFIELRSGVRPSSPDVAATGEVLAIIRLASPAFGPFVNARSFAVATNDPDGINKSGDVAWFRLYNRRGYAVLDGDVSESGGTGDLKLTDAAFRMGGTVDLTNLAIEFP